MSSGSDKTTQTITQTSLPPEYIKPQMEHIAGAARGLYDTGQGPQYFTGSTVIPFSGLTEEALINASWQAKHGNNLNPAAYQTARGIMDRGGLSSGAANSLSVMSSIAGGANGIGTAPQYQGLINSASGSGVAAGAHPSLGLLGNIASGTNGIKTSGDYRSELSRTAGPTAAEQYGTAMARGDMLGANGNPFLSAMLDDQSQRITDQVNSQFSASGRYASGKHTGALAKEIASARLPIMAQQYNQDVQNQMGAMGLIDSSRNAQTGQRQGLLAGLTGIEGQNIGNQMGAANNLSNFYQSAQNQGFQNQLGALQGLTGVQGANIANQGNTAQTMANIYQNAQDESLRTALAAPALAETRYNDLSRLADIGAQYEAKDAERKKDEIARFEFANMRPWNQLSLLSGAVQGANSGGTNTSVTQRPDLPLGQRILGGGMMGAGMGSMIGGPLGGLIGGAGGGLLGLL